MRQELKEEIYPNDEETRWTDGEGEGEAVVANSLSTRGGGIPE